MSDVKLTKIPDNEVRKGDYLLSTNSESLVTANKLYEIIAIDSSDEEC